MHRYFAVFIAVLFVSLDVCSYGAQVDPTPTDVSKHISATIRDFITRKEAAVQNGAIPSSIYNQLVREVTEGFDFPKLTVPDLLALHRVGLLFRSHHLSAVDARIAILASEPDVPAIGAQCLQIQSPSNGSLSDDARTEAMRKILNDARLADALRMGVCGDLFYTIASVVPGARLSELRDDILRLSTAFPTAHESLVDSLDTGLILVRVKDPRDPKTQAFRTSLLEFGQRQLAAFRERGDSEDAIERLRNKIAYLEGRAAKGELLGQSAPELHFVWSSDPSMTSLNDLKGKTVLLAFWTTWCPFCKEAHPTLDDLQTKYADKPLVVLAVSGTTEPVEINGAPTDPKGNPIAAGDAMRRYLASTPTSYPIAMIAGNAIAPDFGAKGVPFLVLIDSQGIVRATGLRPSAPEIISAKIDELLNRP